MPVKTIRQITTFDSVIDIDFGLIRLVLDEFNNPEYLISGIDYLSKDLTTLRVLLASREIENPLSIVFKKEFHDSIDDLRRELYEEYYDQIISLSGETSITRLIAASALPNKQVVENTIICNSDKEVETLVKWGIKAKGIVRQGEETVPSEYSDFILKRFSDLTIYEPIRGHNIFFLEYPFNLELLPDGTLLPENNVCKIVGEQNSLYTIPVYPGIDTLDIL